MGCKPMSKQKDEKGFYLKLRDIIKSKLQGYSGSGKEAELTKYLLFLPDMFYLITKLARDKEVSKTDKAIFAAGALYLISPIDIIPDILFPIGFLDDLVVVALILNRAMKSLKNEELIRKYWVGDIDLFIVVREIIGMADSVLGESVMQKIRNRFK